MKFLHTLSLGTKMIKDLEVSLGKYLNNEIGRRIIILSPFLLFFLCWVVRGIKNKNKEIL